MMDPKPNDVLVVCCGEPGCSCMGLKVRSIEVMMTADENPTPHIAAEVSYAIGAPYPLPN